MKRIIAESELTRLESEPLSRPALTELFPIVPYLGLERIRPYLGMAAALAHKSCLSL